MLHRHDLARQGERVFTVSIGWVSVQLPGQGYQRQPERPELALAVPVEHVGQARLLTRPVPARLIRDAAQGRRQKAFVAGGRVQLEERGCRARVPHDVVGVAALSSEATGPGCTRTSRPRAAPAADTRRQRRPTSASARASPGPSGMTPCTSGRRASGWRPRSSWRSGSSTVRPPDRATHPAASRARAWPPPGCRRAGLGRCRGGDGPCFAATTGSRLASTPVQRAPRRGRPETRSAAATGIG